MKNILVTGGAGYIGSHTCLSLLEKNYNVFVVDSFINSSPKSLQMVLEIHKSNNQNYNNQLKVFKGDITDIKVLENYFLELLKNNITIDGVIHFAGLKAVSESVSNPLIYWNINLTTTFNLLYIIKKFGCNNLVFSSSATIYASNQNDLLTEDSEIRPANPYGNTKATIEKILADVFKSSTKELKFASLRYFNPIGAHSSGLIGEDPKGTPNNLFPLIINTAYGSQKELKIYGSNYPTHDGTPIRDYIHVMDLADAHIKVLEYMMISRGMNINLNIGTGIGTSVLDLVKTFERVNNIKVPYVFADRRIGDSCYVVANNSLSINKLDITTPRDIEDMCLDGWRWKKLNPDGY